MSKNIEADRKADRKIIQTRNYNGRQFNLSSVEKQNCPILVRDTGVRLQWFYISKKSDSPYLFLSDHWFSAAMYLNKTRSKIFNLLFVEINAVWPCNKWLEIALGFKLYECMSFEGFFVVTLLIQGMLFHVHICN